MSSGHESTNKKNGEDSGFLDKLKNKLDRMLGRSQKKSSLDLTLKEDAPHSPAPRRAYRVTVNNMHIVCRTPRVKCKVSDVSADGIGFLSNKEFEVGSIVEAVLLWSGKPILKNIKIKVMRRHKNIVGCQFHELTRSQDKVVSKIVLAAQKRAIKPGSGKKVQDNTDEELIKMSSSEKAEIEMARKGKKQIKL